MRDRSGIFEGSPVELRNQYRDGIQRIPLCVYELDIPVVAAINGAAVGAGLDLACMCDVRIAAEKASFAESFIKLGLVPGDGGAWQERSRSALARPIGSFSDYQYSPAQSPTGGQSSTCLLYTSDAADE